jgi:CRP-like cAMP-binding protein
MVSTINMWERVGARPELGPEGLHTGAKRELAPSPLSRVLSSYAPLEERELAFITEVEGDHHRHPTGSEVVPEDSRHRVLSVVAGWAAQSVLLEDGRRQIVALVLPGELIDLPQTRRLGLVVTAMTALRTQDATRLAHAVASAEPGQGGLSLAWRCLREAGEERLVRHIVRLGRLSAYDRTIDLLVGLNERQRRSGLADASSMNLPLTQEALADYLGLSVVHVNRTLQQLRRDGLITYQSGRVTLHDRKRLIALAAPMAR